MAMYFLSPSELEKHKDEIDEDEEEIPFEEVSSNSPPPPLNIVILIVGSRGDVQPFIAFGKGLQQAGHRVRLATHVTFRQFVTENGLEFYPLKGDPELLMNFMVNHPDMITLDPKEISKKKEIMSQIYHSTWDACTAHNFRAEVIISNPPVNVHVHLAQRLQVPLHIMFTMPWSATKDYMHPLAPMQSRLENKTSYQVVDRMVWIGLGGIQNDFRKKIGLSSIMRGSSLVSKLKVPHIYCMSPHLAPKPTDWESHIDVVGFWYLDLQTNYKPPQDLLDFLAAGPPPVYIGFGSIVVDDPKTLGKNVIDAVIQSGQRALISPGWAKLGEGMDLPPTIKLIGAAPHDWLFPRCAAVCHHGGAGTTAAGLKAGCPTIIVPFFGDQPFWGSCVAQQGVGPTPIPNKQLTAEKLKDAILFCVQPDVQKKAKEFGEKLRNEDGVKTAVEAFHRKLPYHDGLWVEEIQENMRKGIGGWSGKSLLPLDRPMYTEKTGLLEMDISRYVCPPGWEWVDEWTPVVQDSDPDGWRYAKSFTYGNANYHAKEETFDLVRTRRLRRHRKYVGKPETPTGERHLIYVELISGRKLPSKDMVGQSDPFCVLRLASDDNQEQYSEAIENDSAPVWKEVHWFRATKNDNLIVDCYDQDPVGKDFIGSKTIPFIDVFSGKIKQKEAQWYSLSSKTGKPAGELQLSFLIV
jgi:sterol 3beta-glucosyltransferase